MNKTLVFYDSDFPIDGERPSQAFLTSLGTNIETTNALQLEDSLQNKDIQSFINLHGPYFPKYAWGAILNYLKSGRGMVHIGGIPFRIPCYFDNGGWKTERAQTAYHQKLNIHEVLEVDSERVIKLQANEDIPLFVGQESLLPIENTYNFILHVSKSSTIESEMGSSGPMDARIYPLLKGMTKNEREISAPSVLIENMKGTFAGGRWLFINQQVHANFWSENGANFIQKLANYVAAGVTEMWLKTNYASYDEGDHPKIFYQLQSFTDEATDWELKFSMTKDNEVIYTKSESISASKFTNYFTFTVPIDISPGLYKVTCHALSNKGEVRVLHQGFWGMDRKLLQSGEPLAVDRDYFQKDGQPLPIVGMTYMTSDVARYFLFLPNPQVWDKDMAQMKRAGINMIRTGIWTGWRNIMLADGHVDEGVLRTIDAFILSAKKHDLEVTFTFFSFLPEMWEGVNPYLDPRSVEAQKRFIAAIVSRHTDTTNVHWDLINEPSLFDPSNSFSGPRTLQDQYDRKNYSKWLKERHGSIDRLQERWNMTPQELPSFEAVIPPKPTEINFRITDMMLGKKGLKWLDYTLYTMDILNSWAKELSSVIKQLAPKQLITIGQDEGLAGQRPSPLFYSDEVDYTTNHTWWLLDQLLWSGIFSKSPHKPNLIQETGIMYVEQPNNQAKRSEKELRNILERKYAYAFAAGGAGAVQWLWNTNYFMNNINESNIGTIRADGTEKPETDVSYDFGTFMKKERDLFSNRELEDIAVVFPFSNDFSNRKLAFAATTKLTRVLTFEMNIPFRALSEYHLDTLWTNPPKLLVVPSPHHFSSEAMTTILKVVKEQGITLLFTGAINVDEYWKNTNIMTDIIGESVVQNVLREEIIEINGRDYFVSFAHERIADTVKGALLTSENSSAIVETPYGFGEIIWSPIPVELSERNEPIVALYEYVLDKVDINQPFIWKKGDYPGIYGNKLSFEKGFLFIFVSEFSKDTAIEITDPVTNQTYSFTIESDRTVMFATDKQGVITTNYRSEAIEINTI